MRINIIDLPCVGNKFYGQAERAISNGQLNVLLRLHIRPINVVVYNGPSYLTVGKSHLVEGFALICVQRLSRPDFATQLCHWRDNWITRGLFSRVLSYYGQPHSNFLRPPQIGTELSRDVLNPVHVPL